MFVGLWVLGLGIVCSLQLVPYVFLAYEAFLSAVLCIVLKHEWS